MAKCNVHGGLCPHYANEYQIIVDDIEPSLNCRRHWDGRRIKLCEHRKFIARLARARRVSKIEFANQWDQEVKRKAETT